jgi:hypothetical protein
MPLIVLTSGTHPMPPDVPADVREQAALYFRALGLAMTPTLPSPRMVTTSSFRTPGTLSRSTIPRWFSRRSTACYQRSRRNRTINRLFIDKALASGCGRTTGKVEINC